MSEHLEKAIKSLKDDGNDGHKLYVIAEMLFEGTKQLTRIADSFEKKPCQDCCNTAGENIIKEYDNEKDN